MTHIDLRDMTHSCVCDVTYPFVCHDVFYWYRRCCRVCVVKKRLLKIIGLFLQRALLKKNYILHIFGCRVCVARGTWLTWMRVTWLILYIYLYIYVYLYMYVHKCMTWFIHVFVCRLEYMARVYMRDMTHSHVWRDSFICVCVARGICLKIIGPFCKRAL